MPIRAILRGLTAITVLATPALAAAQAAQPLADVLAAADRAWDARRYDEALEHYELVLRRDSTAARAAFRAATLLGWRQEFDGSIALFRLYSRLAPGDDDGRVGLARTLAWSGRYRESIAICDSVLARNPRHADAAILAVQVREWAAWSLQPAVTTTDDSDDNRSTIFDVRGELPTRWRTRVVGDASYRVADLSLVHATSATLRASTSWSPVRGNWTVRGEAGASSGARLIPIIGAHLTERLTPNVALSGGVTHAAFDETAALILNGIATTSVDAATEVSIRRRLGIAGSGSWTQLTGGTGPNTRFAAAGAIRWLATRFVSIAAGARGFAYDHPAVDGYFAPKEYLLAELSGQLHVGGELGWRLDSDLGVGNETIVAFDDSRANRLAERVSTSIAYRPVPGVEWGVSTGYANVASPTTISSRDYHAYTLTVKGRIRL